MFQGMGGMVKGCREKPTHDLLVVWSFGDAVT
jgi:hypothetical protein